MTAAVITGGTRGIGLGLARELLKRGCQVSVCGRSPERVDQAQAELRAINPTGVVASVCDVTDPASVQQLWDDSERALGPIQYWINNAGSSTVPLPLWELPLEQVEATLRSKIWGAAYGAQVAIRGMQKQGGGTIFFMEGMGTRGDIQVGTISLGTGNNAVVYLMKGLLKEHQDEQIKFVGIRPGIIITEHLLHGIEHLSEARWQRTKRIFNILGDKPETTTPWLAEQILAGPKNGSTIRWMSGMKIMARFLTARFKKRDLFAELDLPR
jgi:NAD(P)-dependent dehydrogenase (short-subunit alcohol dehydrogenase family)